MSEPAIIVHGGAKSYAGPYDLIEAKREGVKTAARIGYKVLQAGGSALDAVEATVSSMEIDKVFNAGAGGNLNLMGELEMDALIMEGKNLRAGGVAAVKEIRNPIQLARKILEETEHVLIAGEGATKLAEYFGIPRVDPKELITERSMKKHEIYQDYKKAFESTMKGRQDPSPAEECHDTVGACAFDSSGNLAVATSTGGTAIQLPGRVGDCPSIGAGGYCDNEIGAVSTTGQGESIAKICLARHITGKMSEGLTTTEAIQASLDFMKNRLGCPDAGAVGLSKDGDPGFAFGTEGMSWCSITKDGLKYGLFPGEILLDAVE